MKIYTFPLLLIPLLVSCDGANNNKTVMTAQLTSDPTPGHFAGQLTDYWYQGKAEINTYDLQQVRYGEVHPGKVSLIFVSEDFLTDKQVKNDNYVNQNTTPIIKTNQLRRFTTGIYDYSQMTSVFTPTDLGKQPHSLKVTTSVQDWCGQTYAQFNYGGGAEWAIQLRSYFEKEGDVDSTAPADFLEDELMNRIRMGWKDLPTGRHRVLPASGYLVMMHKPFEAATAELTLGAYAGARFSGEGLQKYTVTYPGLDREVSIVFDGQAPYVIRGWTETYPSRGKTLTTVATLEQQVMEPYWSQNSLGDAPKREALGL